MTQNTYRSGVMSADEIELVYARGQQVFHWRGVCTIGLTISDVLRISGVLQHHPEIDFVTFGIGVWGVLANQTRRVQAGDRVEIYPQLRIDPKAARRSRAEQSRRRS